MVDQLWRGDGRGAGDPDAFLGPYDRLPASRGAARGRVACGTLLRTAWQVRVHGSEHVPVDGPVIVAGNHTGFLDGPLLYGTCPRPVHALTKEEMFVGPLRPLLLSVGQIPICRTAVDRAALRDCLGVLADGRLLGVYPEGTRGEGDFSAIKGGLAWLALRTGAPVVPLASFGVRQPERGVSTALPPLRSRIDAVYGPAFHVEASEPWGPYLPRRVVARASERVQHRLLAHLAYACELTSNPVPASARPYTS